MRRIGRKLNFPRNNLESLAQRGFTLLEVTLALAILAVALTALSTLQARNLTLTAEDRLLTEATLAGRDLLARIQGGQILLENAEGEMGQDHPGWQWAIRVQDLGVTRMARVEILLLKAGMAPERAVRFWFLAYRGSAG